MTVMLGAGAANNMLSHGMERDTTRRYYTREMTSINWTNLALGEDPPPDVQDRLSGSNRVNLEWSGSAARAIVRALRAKERPVLRVSPNSKPASTRPGDNTKEEKDTIEEHSTKTRMQHTVQNALAVLADATGCKVSKHVPNKRLQDLTRSED
ncbi:hypothetical protein CF319_g8478 [Tilletia indica]|nr:hypothetical protein CF319_g8478 [Tilletia indica]